MAGSTRPALRDGLPCSRMDRSPFGPRASNRAGPDCHRLTDTIGSLEQYAADGRVDANEQANFSVRCTHASVKLDLDAADFDIPTVFFDPVYDGLKLAFGVAGIGRDARNADHTELPAILLADLGDGDIELV